ncbi:STAS domain-containing protein [Nonomuraea sp. LP-02]|uniref:STAS domain-containing protein n=1 Tax=Nonomuraea sp. LP-02 TaxID=3097960 RepID=UPI002E2F62A0|nr:STAS domain-containing protein [Nonomuraea sp. LP-02]MED7930413.1 STAS domain-containing protein [Nonomuraea sp. LP-02]
MARPTPQAIVVVLRGVVDDRAAKEVARLLGAHLEQSERWLIFDLSGAERITPGGWRFMLRAWLDAREVGGGATLASEAGVWRTVARQIGLPTSPDVDHALAALDSDRTTSGRLDRRISKILSAGRPSDEVPLQLGMQAADGGERAFLAFFGYRPSSDPLKGAFSAALVMQALADVRPDEVEPDPALEVMPDGPDDEVLDALRESLLPRGAQESFAYLGDAESAPAVERALRQFGEAFGWEVTPRSEPLEGSWFRRFRLKARDLAMSADAKEIAEELRRAAELRALHSVQAENDSKQAQAAATLIQALDGTEQAVVMVGSVLVIKDAGRLAVRTLTQRQLIFLERSADMTQPSNVLEALELCGAADDPPPTRERSLPSGEEDD